MPHKAKGKSTGVYQEVEGELGSCEQEAFLGRGSW